MDSQPNSPERRSKPTLLNSSIKLREKEYFPNSILENNTILLLKSDKDPNKKKRTTSLSNEHKYKILKKIQ